MTYVGSAYSLRIGVLWFKKINKIKKQAMVRSGSVGRNTSKESHKAEASRCKIRETKTEMAR